MEFKKKYLLIAVAVLCIALYFCGSYTKNNQYVQYLPILGGLAFGLNTLIQLAH